MTPQPAVRAADPIERLRAAFFMGRNVHTADAYQRDLADFLAFVRGWTVTNEPNPIGQTAIDNGTLRLFFSQSPGEANEMVLHYRHDLESRHKATATIARHLSVVKNLVKYARMTGLVTWAIEILPPRIERSRDTRGPSLDTIQSMLRLAAAQPSPTAERDVALVRVAYDLALRIGELAKLDVADVELKTATLWIFGKGRRAKELVQMPPTSVDAIREWLRVRGSKPGPLFLSYANCNRQGRLVTRGVYRIIRDLGAAAGMHVRPHGLRHTAITQAIDLAAKNGLSIDLVRQFSRHRSLNTLMIYRDLHDSKQGLLAGWVAAQVPQPSGEH
jgi:integrase/recombinase XerC